MNQSTITAFKPYQKVKRGDGVTKERVIGSGVGMVRKAK